MANSIKLTAAITRNYGAVSATFGAERELTPEQVQGGIKSYYNSLVQVIHHQFDEYEANELKHEPRTQPEPKPANPLPGGGVWYTAVRLYKEVKKGKEYYAIITAEHDFAKHGAACYKEFIEEYALTLRPDQFDLEFPAGTKVLVMQAGQYKKCTKLEFVKG